MTTSWCAARSHGRRSAGLSRSGHQRSGHHGGKPPCLPDPPEYAELPPITIDKEAAYAMLQESGHADHVFEISSIDDDYRRNTTDAVAAQLRDAGFNVERVVIPGSTFWNDWTTYPFSSTNWNHRELGVIILNLAYRSGVAWNESASPTPSSTRFSTRPTASRRRCPPRDHGGGCRDHAGRRRDAAALLAVALPALQAPAWSTRKCIRSSRSTSTTWASKPESIWRPGLGNEVRALLFPAGDPAGVVRMEARRNEAPFAPAKSGPHN
jgi:hypothetical protein